MDTFSLSGHHPVLLRLEILHIHPSLDTYQIFHFEPMHNLAPGISKTLKECTYNLLGDNEIMTSAIYNNGNRKPLNQARSKIVMTVNKLLETIESESVGYGLHADFSSKSVLQFIERRIHRQGHCGYARGKGLHFIGSSVPILGCSD